MQAINPVAYEAMAIPALWALRREMREQERRASASKRYAQADAIGDKADALDEAVACAAAKDAAGLACKLRLAIEWFRNEFPIETQEACEDFGLRLLASIEADLKLIEGERG